MKGRARRVFLCVGDGAGRGGRGERVVVLSTPEVLSRFFSGDRSFIMSFILHVITNKAAPAKGEEGDGKNFAVMTCRMNDMIKLLSPEISLLLSLILCRSLPLDPASLSLDQLQTVNRVVVRPPPFL